MFLFGILVLSCVTESSIFCSLLLSHQADIYICIWLGPPILAVEATFKLFNSKPHVARCLFAGLCHVAMKCKHY